jgi:hypothetical protein
MLSVRNHARDRIGDRHEQQQNKDSSQGGISLHDASRLSRLGTEGKRSSRRGLDLSAHHDRNHREDDQDQSGDPEGGFETLTLAGETRGDTTSM